MQIYHVDYGQYNISIYTVNSAYMFGSKLKLSVIRVQPVDNVRYRRYPRITRGLQANQTSSTGYTIFL